MRLHFVLTQTNAQISRLILDCMTDEVNKSILKAGAHIQLRIRDRIVTAIQTSPAYISLSKGVLQMDFGLARPGQVLDGLVTIWKQELNVVFDRFRARGSGIVGSFAIDAIDASFSKVRSSSYASYLSNGNVVDWLNWLLTSGTSSVVRGYDVYYGASSASRTGLALMRPSLSRNFSVNSAYAGTVTDNFVTEAIEKAEDDFLTIIQEEIEKAL